MGDDRPPVYYEQDNLIIRASAIGSSCLFELVAAGQGLQPSPIPAKLQRAFDEGNELEPVVVKKLTDYYNYNFLSHQTEGNYGVADREVVRYHPDGIANITIPSLTNSSPMGFKPSGLARIGDKVLVEKVVVEIKALTNDLWQKFVRHGMGSVMDEYPWQLSIMMLDTGYPGMWVGYNKGPAPDEDGNRADHPDKGRLHFELVPTPPITADEIRNKVAKVKELIEGEDILTSGQVCNDPNQYPCRFLAIRPQVESNIGVYESVVGAGDKGGSVLVVEGGDKGAFDEAVKQYQYHKGQEDEHKTARERAKGEIIRLAGGTSGKLKSDKWLVPVYEGHGAKTYDWSAMPKELKDELKKYERSGKPYLYLRGIKRMD